MRRVASELTDELASVPGALWEPATTETIMGVLKLDYHWSEIQRKGGES